MESRSVRRGVPALAAALLAAACAREPARAPLEGRSAADVRAELEAVAERIEAGRNPFFATGRLREVRARFARPDLAPLERMTLWARLGEGLLNQGRIEAAEREIAGFLAYAERFPELVGGDTSRFRLSAVAHLREAENLNCIERRNPQCCIFPLEGGGRHVRQDPARLARQDLLEVLARDPDALDARWLLMVAAMAVGEYPDGVDARLSIPIDAFEAPPGRVGRFVDVAASVGVDAFDLCGGAAAEDFDGDGLLDLVASTSDPRGGMHFWRGLPGMGFEDATERSGLGAQLGGFNVVPADFDDDGDRDLLVLRGAWLQDEGCIRNSLLQNDGAGAFEDVTRASGVAEPALPSQAAAWGDFDGDGDLDLYVVNESREEIDPAAPSWPSQLYVNGGDGRFVDAAVERGVENRRLGKGAAVGDYDNDGDIDLYVSNWGPNRLYENDGAGGFADVAAAEGVEEPVGRSFATWFFDVDGDGWLELFVASFEARLADVAASYLGLPNEGRPPRLYANRAGRFEDATARSGLERTMLVMGAGFGDLDGDGRQDLLLATGDVGLEVLTPNVALRNVDGTRFEDVTIQGGLGHLQKGHGVVFADLDEDGDQDVYAQLGGFFPVDRFANALFENPSPSRAWLKVALRGVRSNRDGIGARIDVVVEEGGATRRIHRAVGSVSSFGAAPLRQEIGLGDATRIVSLEVRWPSGVRQRFEDVPRNSIVEVVELEDELRVLRRGG